MLIIKGACVQIGDVVIVDGIDRYVDAFEARRTEPSRARVALAGRFQFAVPDDAEFRVYRDRA